MHFNNHGTTLASGGGDDTVRLWDMSNPEAEPTILRGHESWITSVAFSPDSTTLASGGFDQTICPWIRSIAPPAQISLLSQSRRSRIGLKSG